MAIASSAVSSSAVGELDDGVDKMEAAATVVGDMARVATTPDAGDASVSTTLMMRAFGVAPPLHPTACTVFMLAIVREMSKCLLLLKFKLIVILRKPAAVAGPLVVCVASCTERGGRRAAAVTSWKVSASAQQLALVEAPVHGPLEPAQ